MKMHAFNLVYYTPKLWERVILSFCPLRQHVAPGSVVFYKKFVNRLYVCGYVRVYTASLGATSRGYENAGYN